MAGLRYYTQKDADSSNAQGLKILLERHHLTFQPKDSSKGPKFEYLVAITKVLVI